MNEALDRAADILARAGAPVKRGVPLAPLTTFRIGGPAAIYIEPESERDLAAVARSLQETGAPFLVIGKGSNLLIADEGFPGIVLRLGRGFRWAARDGHGLTTGGSMPLPALAGVALRHGLAGLEFGVAIPATVGGAVVMNAGAHTGDMGQVLESIRLYRMDEGEAVSLLRSDAGLSYRHSTLPPRSVVIGANLVLRPGSGSDIRGLMDEAKAWRKRTQPLAEPNCGSVFTNPEGEHAARLIEAAGGKSLRVGGAAVSQKHSNFIVAEPGASAADVRALIIQIQDLVERTAGVRLETEVRFVGVPDAG